MKRSRTSVFTTLLLLGMLGLAAYFYPPHKESPPAPNAQTATSTQREPAEEKQSRSVSSSIGFASRTKLVQHFEKHGREFGRISLEEYLQKAQVLRDAVPGRDILEHIRADGVVTRFERSTGAFIAFNPDKTIRTYFRPNDGKEYFHRQARR